MKTDFWGSGFGFDDPNSRYLVWVAAGVWGKERRRAAALQDAGAQAGGIRTALPAAPAKWSHYCVGENQVGLWSASVSLYVSA
jgi:hypothetical protein